MNQLTCKELREGYGALRKLSSNTDIPISRAMEFSRARKALEPDVEQIENRETALLRKHAARDEDGKVKKTPQGGTELEDQEAFFDARRELMDEVVEIPEFHAVSVETLVDWEKEYESLQLSGDDVTALVDLGVAEQGDADE